MAKSPTKHKALATAADHSSKSPIRSATMTHSDIAGRAYDFYLARGCEHGYELDDWLRAEQELKDASNLTDVRR